MYEEVYVEAMCTSYKLTEKDVAAIEKALNRGKGTFEAVVKTENGKVVVLQVVKTKIET